MKKTIQSHTEHRTGGYSIRIMEEGDDYNIYYGDSIRGGNSKRKIVRKEPDPKSDANVSKMMKYHCVTGVVLVMTIVLCSAVEVVLIKDPFGFQSAQPAERLREACDIGWIDGDLVQLGCLLFGKEKMNLTQAVTFCEKKSSRLVEIHSTNQKLFITGYIRIINDINYAKISWWTGGTVSRTQDWVWADSRLSVQDFVWATGHPVADQNRAMCLYTNPSSKIDAYACLAAELLKPICQVQ